MWQHPVVENSDNGYRHHRHYSDVNAKMSTTTLTAIANTFDPPQRVQIVYRVRRYTENEAKSDAAR